MSSPQTSTPHTPETRDMLLLRAFFEPSTAREASAMVSVEQMRTEPGRFMAGVLSAMVSEGIPTTPENTSIYLQSSYSDTPDQAGSRVALILEEEPPTPDFFPVLVHQVSVDADRAARKELAQWLIGDGAKARSAETIDRINTYLRANALVQPDDFTSMKDGIRELLSPGEGIKNYGVGFGKMDDHYRIFQGSFNVILADSGVGKSAAMMNMALNLAKHGVNVYIFSIEMDKNSLNARGAGIMSGLTAYRIEEKSLTPQEHEHALHIERENAAVFSRVFVTSPSGLTAESVHAMILKVTSKRGPGVVFIDYLQLLTASGRHITNETSMQAQVSKTLMLAAKATETPIIALSQVTATNSGMELVKGSKQPKNDAWTLLLLERHDETDESDQVVIKAKILKNRKRKKGGTYNLVYNLPTQRIYYSDEVN